MKDIFKDLIDEKVSEALSSAASKMEELQSKRDEINRLINSTVDEFRKKTEAIAKEQGVFTEKTYTDEPILFVASKMKNYTPKEITEMRKLEKGASWSALSDPGIFYKQAKFMENYEDDYEYKGDFHIGIERLFYVEKKSKKGRNHKNFPFLCLFIRLRAFKLNRMRK